MLDILSCLRERWVVFRHARTFSTLLIVCCLLILFTACGPTPDPSCPSDAECVMDLDCGTNQVCDDCQCRCSGSGGNPSCTGQYPGTTGSCGMTVSVQWGIGYDTQIIGRCGPDCECVQCVTDADCSPYTECEQATHTCQPRLCTTSCTDCTSIDCFELEDGTCGCASTFDLFGCPDYSECVGPSGNSRYPGDSCMLENMVGTCNTSCECEIDNCPVGPCFGLSNGDTCQIAANTQTLSGTCHDCSCLCSGGTNPGKCAGLPEGANCEYSTGFWGNCKDCQCETCPEASPCYGLHDEQACTTTNGQSGYCFNCTCKPVCVENSPCQDKRENAFCEVNGQAGTCQDCECVVCQEGEGEANSCYQKSVCDLNDDHNMNDLCLDCMCCPENSDQCNSDADCYSGLCDTATCNCLPGSGSPTLPAPPPPPPEDPCSEHGGLGWEGDRCDCPETTYHTIICKDGTWVENVDTGVACTPDPDLNCHPDEPPPDDDGGNCVCRQVCVQWNVVAQPAVCVQYAYRDTCTGSACQP